MKQLFSCYLKCLATFTMSFFILLLAATKANAQWSELGGAPFNNGIISIATDISGNVYAAGYFNDSNKFYIGKWNGTEWNELGGAPFNLQIESIAIDTGGNVYAGGDFTDANSKHYVAKWDGTSWSELGGAPFNNQIVSIAIDASGNVYAGGDFTDANSKHYVAKWDGTSWSELGGAPFNKQIESIATDADGNVYVGGDFTDANHKYYVAKWNGTAWSELGGNNGSTFNSNIYSITTDANRNVYAGGGFTDANNKHYVAKWNDTAWSELGGAPFNSIIFSIATDADGNVYAGGGFNVTLGNIYVAKWNGTSWNELGGAPFNNIILSITTDVSGNVYTGGDFYDTSGKFYVAKYSQGEISILPAHPSTVTADYESTDSMGWTNYYSGGTLLLSLNTHGQNIGTIGDGTFAVTLAATAGAGSNTGIQLTNPLITNTSGYWVMNRYWQVTATTEPTTPVDVRFYYNNQDLADVNGSYPGHNLTNGQLIFYKETGGNPDPTTNLAGATSVVSILPSTYASDTTWTYHPLTDSTQYAEFSVSSFSGGGGGGTGNGQVLPLNILSFTATQQGAANLLQWTTGQEINSSYFGIERSPDGVNFTTIGQVSAAGNNRIAKSYSLLDTKPISGTNYYRLKMVDKDGGFTYSPVRTVNDATHFSASIYPNPVQNHLSLLFNSDKAQTVGMQIVNSEGKVMATQQIEVAAGVSTHNMNTASLSNGAYYIRLVSEEGQTRVKFVKER